MDRTRRPWTGRDLAELHARFPVERTSDIARSMNRTPGATARKAKLLGLQKSDGRYQRLQKHYSLDAQAFRVLTCDTAYLLGLILADGSISGDRVKITNNSLDAIQFARCLLGSNHRITVPRDPRDRAFTLIIRNTELAASLRCWGITENKSLTGTWPGTVPPRLFGCLLRGYFDGDGYAGYGNRAGLRIKFTSGSRPLLDGLAMMLHQRGMLLRHTECDNGHPNANRLWYYGPAAAHIGKMMYAHAGFYLPYKRQPFLDYAARGS